MVAYRTFLFWQSIRSSCLTESAWPLQSRISNRLNPFGKIVLLRSPNYASAELQEISLQYSLEHSLVAELNALLGALLKG